MIPDEEKYKAQVLQIIGITLLTPIAKVLLEPGTMFNDLGLVWFIYYVIASFIALSFGIILIDRGRDILSIRRRSFYGD